MNSLDANILKLQFGPWCWTEEYGQTAAPMEIDVVFVSPAVKPYAT